jgi:hypothetical protein
MRLHVEARQRAAVCRLELTSPAWSPLFMSRRSPCRLELGWTWYTVTFFQREAAAPLTRYSDTVATAVCMPMS